MRLRLLALLILVITSPLMAFQRPAHQADVLLRSSAEGLLRSPSPDLLEALQADVKMVAGIRSLACRADGQLSSLHGRLSEPIRGDLEAEAQTFLREHPRLVGLPPADGPFQPQLIARTTGGGGTHFRFAVAEGTVAYVRTGCPQSGLFAANTSLREAGAGWGNHVVLYHGNGIYTRYAHLAPGTIKAKPGDRVIPGDILGEMGNSGRSDVRHLHFEIGFKSAPLVSNKSAQSFDLVFDPKRYLPENNREYSRIDKEFSIMEE